MKAGEKKRKEKIFRPFFSRARVELEQLEIKQGKRFFKNKTGLH